MMEFLVWIQAYSTYVLIVSFISFLAGLGVAAWIASKVRVAGK